MELNNSRYNLEGNFTPTSQGLYLNANVSVDQENIQTILETFQFFGLKDIRQRLTPPQYAKAEDLYEIKETRNTEPRTVLNKSERTRSSLAASTPQFSLAEVGGYKATISDRLLHFLAIND